MGINVDTWSQKFPHTPLFRASLRIFSPLIQSQALCLMAQMLRMKRQLLLKLTRHPTRFGTHPFNGYVQLGKSTAKF